MQGKVLAGRYKIISHLGGGGFGQTYVAEDQQLPDTPKCVVKQFQPIVANAQALEVASRLFDREARTLHKLGSHDQIPRLLAHFEEDNEFFLVQDYIDGNTLAQEIHQRKRLSQAEVISLLQDILSTLEYVHQQNVIHRDIKPSNLIRRKRDGKLALIDFGAVKQISQQRLNEQGETDINTTISTRGYTPLEQLEGHPRFNSDIYALGITAIQALTGIDPKQLQRNVKTGLIVWREQVQVSDELAAILDTMVHTNSRERYQSVDEVVNDLRSMMRSSEAPTVAIAKTSEAPTVAGPEISTEPPSTSKTAKLPSNVSSKLGWLRPVKPWYILVTLAFLGGLELIYPIFRPIYYLQRGEKLLESQKPQEALENFQKLTGGIKPKNPQAWKSKGNALFQLERYEGALAAYDKALQLQPNDSKTLNNKGKVFYQIGRYQEALDVYEQAIKIAPDDASAWHGKGLALISLERTQESLAAFDTAKAIQPQDPTVWQSKGLALEYLQRQQEAIKVYEEALAVYEETVKKKPIDSTAWTDRGTVLSKFQRFPEAINSYEKALKIKPDFYEALLGKANVLASLQRYDEALKFYDQVVKTKPNDYQTWHIRGDLLARSKKDYKAAIKSYDQALEFQPRFYPALLGKGLALTSLEQYSEALSAVDKAKDIQANDQYVWANRGFVLEKMGKKAEAIASYEKAIEINPKFQQAIDALKQLQQ